MSARVTFPDQQQTEEYLSTLSRRTARRFRKFIKATEPEGCTSYSGLLAARLFVQSLNWGNVDLEPSAFSYRLSKLSEPGIIDLFEKLSTESQETLWKRDLALSNFAANCTTEAYFNLLIRTGLSAKFCASLNEVFIAETVGEVTHLLLFFWSSEEDRWKPRVSATDIKIAEPSKQFRRALLHVFQNKYKNIERIDDSYKYRKLPVNFDTKATEGSIMLSVLYGEHAVIELLSYAAESKINMCLQDAITVLDARQENPEYPVEWILNTVQNRHDHSVWKDLSW